MLYNALKPLVKLSIQGFFRDIHFIGKENLELDGAILVSNHPSALMDPIVIAAFSKKRLSFIAGAEWFGSGIKDWIFKKQFNMIPVQRPWLVKNGEKVSNKDMFEACYKSLDEGKRIIIYPEASSLTVPWIRELKSGAARIKIGADHYMKGNKVTKIVPIGMNYANAHRFHSDLLVNVGKPIDFGEILTDQSIDDKERSDRMTEVIRKEMKAQVLHIEYQEDLLVIKNVLKLLSDILMKDLNISEGDIAGTFRVKKDIISSVEYFKAQKSEAMGKLGERLSNYIKGFEEEGFRRFNPFEKSSAFVVRTILIMLFGFPIFIVGAVMNIIPFAISKWAFQKFLLEKVSVETKQGAVHPAFAGSFAYAVALVVFLLWYILISIIVTNLYMALVSIPVALFVGYQTGRYAIRYVRLFRKLMKIWRWSRLKRNDPAKVDYLLAEREAIIKELMELRKDYEKALA